ncbi:unnamed protein product [Amoebophrya sp. A25]|nr:unnamed protein product [Amoebophrya sp. A25]|eukprot:GSA25T00002261001.1
MIHSPRLAWVWRRANVFRKQEEQRLSPTPGSKRCRWRVRRAVYTGLALLYVLGFLSAHVYENLQPDGDAYHFLPPASPGDEPVSTHSRPAQVVAAPSGGERDRDAPRFRESDKSSTSKTHSLLRRKLRQTDVRGSNSSVNELRVLNETHTSITSDSQAAAATTAGSQLIRLIARTFVGKAFTVTCPVVHGRLREAGYDFQLLYAGADRRRRVRPKYLQFWSASGRASSTPEDAVPMENHPKTEHANGKEANAETSGTETDSFSATLGRPGGLLLQDLGAVVTWGVSATEASALYKTIRPTGRRQGPVANAVATANGGSSLTAREIAAAASAAAKNREQRSAKQIEDDTEEVALARSEDFASRRMAENGQATGELLADLNQMLEIRGIAGGFFSSTPTRPLHRRVHGPSSIVSNSRVSKKTTGGSTTPDQESAIAFTWFGTSSEVENPVDQPIDFSSPVVFHLRIETALSFASKPQKDAGKQKHERILEEQLATVTPVTSSAVEAAPGSSGLASLLQKLHMSIDKLTSHLGTPSSLITAAGGGGGGGTADIEHEKGSIPKERDEARSADSSQPNFVLPALSSRRWEHPRSVLVVVARALAFVSHQHRLGVALDAFAAQHDMLLRRAEGQILRSDHIFGVGHLHHAYNSIFSQLLHLTALQERFQQFRRRVESPPKALAVYSGPPNSESTKLGSLSADLALKWRTGSDEPTTALRLRDYAHVDLSGLQNRRRMSEKTTSDAEEASGDAMVALYHVIQARFEMSELLEEMERKIERHKERAEVYLERVKHDHSSYLEIWIIILIVIEILHAFAEHGVWEMWKSFGVCLCCGKVAYHARTGELLLLDNNPDHADHVGCSENGEDEDEVDTVKSTSREDEAANNNQKGSRSGSPSVVNAHDRGVVLGVSSRPDSDADDDDGSRANVRQPTGDHCVSGMGVTRPGTGGILYTKLGGTK